MSVGRREEPVDPNAGPVASFAYDLRKLRVQAGSPSYRRLAVEANYSASALSGAARGSTLPSWPVVRAYVRACGGDEDEWHVRWLETASHEPADVAPDHDPVPIARRGDAPTPGVLGPDPVHRPRSRFPPQRVAAAAAALSAMTAVALATIVLARDDRPRAVAAATASGHPTTFLADGHACDPNGIVAHADPAASVLPRPTIRMTFDDGAPGWGPYWNAGNVRERHVTDHPYQGTDSLEVSVGPGLAAIGTVYVDGLTPGASVTVHVWYGGQGEGVLCPFVQDGRQVVQWIPAMPLVLTPTRQPGWLAYAWRMPDVATIHGIGLQLNNPGSANLLIDLDSVTW